MFEKFTPDVIDLFHMAMDEGRSLHHNYLSTEMFVSAFIKRGKNFPDYLKNISYDLYRTKMIKIIGRGPSYKTIIEMPLTPSCKKIMQLAASEKEKVTSEDLVNTILSDPDVFATRIYWDCIMEIDKMRLSLLEMSRIIEKNLPHEIFKNIIIAAI